MKKFFVEENSIVRKIWGSSDTVLLIFAGGAAEFALNKAVDWLYFTGKLPSDPLGRLFSTVSYARVIVFAEEQTAIKAIRSMAVIHAQVEAKRGSLIPDWAYRDVLFMLIDYSIRSYELLERKLSLKEKEEVFIVFNRVGENMGITGLPESFEDWLSMRERHLEMDLVFSAYTKDLFSKYRNHLGVIRYQLLIEGQKLVVPSHIVKLLKYSGFSWVAPIVPLYKLSKVLGIDKLIKSVILPAPYKSQVMQMDLSYGISN